MARGKKGKKEVDVTELKECPDCGSVNIKHNEEKQQLICLDCGLIYEPLSPDLEQQFETAHESAPRTRLEVGELMPAPAPEKPVRAKKKLKKKPKKKVKKKPKKKPKKKVKKKAVKKKPKKKPKKVKKAVKKAKKKPAKKKPAKKKPAKKKPAKKVKKKPAKKPAKKGFASRLVNKLTRVRKKKGAFTF